MRMYIAVLTVVLHPAIAFGSSNLECVGGAHSLNTTSVADLNGGSSPEDYDGFAVLPTNVGRVAYSISPTHEGYHFTIRGTITGQSFLDEHSDELIGRHEIEVNDRLTLYIECTFRGLADDQEDPIN